MQAEKDLEAILAMFTPGMSLYVPDELLALWYPPGPANGQMPTNMEEAISHMAALCSCSFAYVAEKNAGCFVKLARC